MTAFVSLEDFEIKEAKFKQWLRDNGVAEEHLDHVAKCCKAALAHRLGVYDAGAFSSAIEKGDFFLAALGADHINQRYLRTYALFNLWLLPKRWEKCSSSK